MIPFTIDDAETPGDLTVMATSSNQTRVPDANIVLGGAGADRTIQITPADNQFGSTVITITVSDGSLTASDTFNLNINSVNDKSTISDVANLSTDEDTQTPLITFTISDVDNAPSRLVVTATSSNQIRVPDANITLGGMTANRNIRITPAANQTGTATITLTVSDGTATNTDQFVLKINPVNDAPTISNIINYSISQNTTTDPIPFTIGDVDNAPSTLSVTPTSSNQLRVQDTSIVLSENAANRTIRLTPVTNKSGNTTITDCVSDRALQACDNFVLMIVAPADAIFQNGLR